MIEIRFKICNFTIIEIAFVLSTWTACEIIKWTQIESDDFDRIIAHMHMRDVNLTNIRQSSRCDNLRVLISMRNFNIDLILDILKIYIGKSQNM